MVQIWCLNRLSAVYVSRAIVGTAGTPQHIFSVFNSLLCPLARNIMRQSRIVLGSKYLKKRRRKEKLDLTLDFLVS